WGNARTTLKSPDSSGPPTLAGVFEHVARDFSRACRRRLPGVDGLWRTEARSQVPNCGYSQGINARVLAVDPQGGGACRARFGQTKRDRHSSSLERTEEGE